MDSLEIVKKESEFQIQGFPYAAKVIKLAGPQALLLADLTLHLSDLHLAKECLEGINSVPATNPSLRTGLWHSAIVHFMKCFGESKSRKFRLIANDIYSGHSEALPAFTFFKNLRDKHVVHDENSLSECLVGAVINERSANCKVAKIVAFGTTAVTLEHDNFNNLNCSITAAIDWCTKKFDSLCVDLTSELESEDYDQLIGREIIVWKTPIIEDIGKKRQAET